MAFNKKFDKHMSPTEYAYEWFLQKCSDINMDSRRANNSLGTLGGGNHFIEMGVSHEQDQSDLWLTIHTGSRQLGERVCRYWQTSPAAKDREEAQKVFKAELNKIKATYKTKEERKKISAVINELKTKLGLDRPIKSKELDFLGGDNMQGYLSDMIFAQAYAKVNRQLILDKICEILGCSIVAAIETVHNYIDLSDFIVRKGAVASYINQLMVIPFNMEDGSLICEGKSNPEWNYSAPHGAGRLYSRSKAKEKFFSEDAKKRMEEKEIYTSVIPTDEVKEAYKDPEMIEKAIEPTAKVIARVKPILNLKAGYTQVSGSIPYFKGKPISS